MTLKIVPIDRESAKQFVAQHHRHHPPALSWKFGAGVEMDGLLVGVVMVGRPVARALDDGFTLEVTRCCTTGAKNAASMLYGAAWRAASALGYRRVITYTLETETGTSLVAAGWDCEGVAGGGSWSCPSRPREDHAPTQMKRRWAKKKEREA